MIKHGVYSIEDTTGSLDLEMTETKFHKGLYTENCFVLVEGWYEDRVFHVVAMGHPPIEASEVSTTLVFFIRVDNGVNAILRDSLEFFLVLKIKSLGTKEVSFLEVSFLTCQHAKYRSKGDDPLLDIWHQPGGN